MKTRGGDRGFRLQAIGTCHSQNWPHDKARQFRGSRIIIDGSFKYLRVQRLNKVKNSNWGKTCKIAQHDSSVAK